MMSQKIIKRIINTVLVFILCFIWLLLWYRNIGKLVLARAPHYHAVLTSSLDDLRGMLTDYGGTSRDYYKILNFCNRNVSENAKIQLVIPLQPQYRHEFLREKGRYYLYPHNYGNNSEENPDYILVYDVEDFIIPPHYKVKRLFTKDKYLLSKEEVQ